MRNLRAIVSVLAAPNDAGSSRNTRLTRIQVILVILFVATIGITYAIVLHQVWENWQIGDTSFNSSSMFLGVIAGSIQFFGILLKLYLYLIQARTLARLRQRVVAVRDAFLAGDERLAPIASVQPEPVTDIAISASPLQIDPLPPLRASSLSAADVVAAIVIVLSMTVGMIVAAIVLVSVTTPDASNNPPLWVGEALGGAAFVLFVPALWRLIRTVRLARPHTLDADDLGLRWTRHGRRLRQGPILWSEARAFYTVSYTLPNVWGARHVYVLDSGDQRIAWTVREGAGPNAERERAASTQLAGLICARTKIPLRDLTVALEEAAGEQQRTPGKALQRQLATSAPTSRREFQSVVDAAKDEYLATGTAALPQQPQRSEGGATSADDAATDTPVRQALALAGLSPSLPKQNFRGGCALFLVVLVAYALLFAGQWGFGQYQSRYLASLPAQVHAEQPIYADSFARDTGYWYTNFADNKDGYRAYFQDHSYRLSATKNESLQQWRQYGGFSIYGDVAVQVTVRQIGSIPGKYGAGDGVGLTLRASGDDNSFLAFYVSPTDGSWNLSRYKYVDSNADDNWFYLDGDTSSAIHTGANAANTLLVILRGGVYLLYANGHYLGSFADGHGYNGDHVTTPRSGHMGVYLNDGSTTGVYTNFAIYPVQPPSSLWVV